jgi:hypothetical protein
MNRRQFIAAGGAAGFVVARGSISTAASPTPTPVLMKLGCQSAPTNDVHLKYLARYGVQNICGYPEIEGDRLYATVDELKRMMDMAAKYGISIDCIAPPFLASSFIDQEKHPAIMLAQSPERDRDSAEAVVLGNGEKTATKVARWHEPSGEIWVKLGCNMRPSSAVECQSLLRRAVHRSGGTMRDNEARASLETTKLHVSCPFLRRLRTCRERVH